MIHAERAHSQLQYIQKGWKVSNTPLEKSALRANGRVMCIKRKVVIQSAYDVEYICLFELKVFASDSPEERMNILGLELLAKVGEFMSLRNFLLILKVFEGRCVKPSLFSKKLFRTIHKLTP